MNSVLQRGQQVLNIPTELVWVLLVELVEPLWEEPLWQEPVE
jgi:hypothetical protein